MTETPQSRSHVKGKFMNLETLAPPAGNLGKQLNARRGLTLTVAFGNNHTPWVSYYHQSQGLTDAVPVLKLMENLVLASRAPGKLAHFEKNPFSSFPQATPAIPQPWESFGSLDASLFTLLQHCLFGRSLSGLFLSSSWSSFPKNNVYFVAG